MFFPGSHLALNPPVFDDFSEPEGAQVVLCVIIATAFVSMAIPLSPLAPARPANQTKPFLLC
jgi:hypothetical protein